MVHKEPLVEFAKNLFDDEKLIRHTQNVVIVITSSTTTKWDSKSNMLTEFIGIAFKDGVETV